MMKRIGLLLLLLLVAAGGKAEAGMEKTDRAQGQAIGTPTAAGVSAFVDSFVAQKMEAAHAPGVVAVVVQGEQVLLARGYGLADVESGRPLTTQTPLRAGSVSKVATAAGVLQGVARGELALGAPVSTYLPKLLPPDAGTLSQFLALKGGYADVVVETHTPSAAAWQPLGVYLRERLPAPVLPPGKVHSYNSWEHALLGQALAEVMGQPFDEVMASLLFRPLGMAHSTFTQPLLAPLAAELAQGYVYREEGYEKVPLDYVHLSPGIAMVTNGDDMGRLMRALLNDGWLDGERVLAPATVAGMLERQEAVHPRSRGRSYGFSEITLGGRRALYQDGNGIGQANRMILVPERRLGIFLSTNHRPLAGDASSTPAFDLIKELGTALLQQYVPPALEDNVERLAPWPGAAERAGRYAGHYRLAGTPQTDFFRLGALLDNVDVKDNGDGTVMIGSGRYAEVEPLLFQSQGDPDFFVVFAEDEAGEARWLTFGGTGSYEKVTWYETPTFHLALVAALALAFLLFVVAMPVSGQRSWTLWLMALLNLAFFAGLALMMARADLILFFKTIPWTTKLLFLLPWLSSGLALLLPPVLVGLWRQPAGLGVRLLYLLQVPAAAGFVWFVYYWRVFWR